MPFSCRSHDRGDHDPQWRHRWWTAFPAHHRNLPGQLMGVLEPFMGSPISVDGRHRGHRLCHRHGYSISRRPSPFWCRCCFRYRGGRHRIPSIFRGHFHHDSSRRHDTPPVGVCSTPSARQPVTMDQAVRGVLPFLFGRDVGAGIACAFPGPSSPSPRPGSCKLSIQRRETTDEETTRRIGHDNPAWRRFGVSAQEARLGLCSHPGSPGRTGLDSLRGTGRRKDRRSHSPSKPSATACWATSRDAVFPAGRISRRHGRADSPTSWEPSPSFCSSICPSSNADFDAVDAVYRWSGW